MAYDLKYDILLRAVQFRDQKEAVALFESGLFDVNQPIDYIFEDGKRFTITPLYWAVRHNCPDLCKYLLSKGADPYPEMVYEYYPLHEACNRGYDRVLQEFVNAGCDLDLVNADLDTPLHVACMRGHIQCVHILLRAKTDCSLENKLGHTAVQSAFFHNRNELLDLFKAHDKAPATTHKAKSTRAAVLSNSSSVRQTLTVSSQNLAQDATVQRRHSFNSVASHSRAQHPSLQSHVHRLSRPLSYANDSDRHFVSTDHCGLPVCLVRPAMPQCQLVPGPEGSLPSAASSFSESFLQSFPTTFSHLSGSSSLGDVCAEKDAPHRSSKSLRRSGSRNAAHTEAISGGQSSKSDRCPQTKSRPHSTGSVIQAGGGAELVIAQSTSRPFAAAAAAGGKGKELNDKLSATKPLHPLSASQKSHGNRNMEKHLYERMSHPEFSVAKWDVQVTNRAKSSQDVFRSSAAGVKRGGQIVPSASRQRINSLSSILCNTLSLDPASQHHLRKPAAQTDVHPLLSSLRTCLQSLAHQFHLSSDHLKALVALTSSSSPFSSPTLEPSPRPPVSYGEVEYEIVEGPLESSVCVEEEGSVKYVQLAYKVQLKDALVQLRSEMHRGDIVLLKVRIPFEHTSDEPHPSFCSQLDEPHPSFSSQPAEPCPSFCSETAGSPHEAALLQRLPPHLNIVPVPYHCRGSSDRFQRHLLQFRSQFHSARSSDPRLESEEPQNGTETHACTDSSPCDLLFQSLPGSTLEKFFAEFLLWYKSDMEEKFLHILAQILLAVAHLRKNCVAHCSINPKNIYVSDGAQKVVLGEFGHALNLRPSSLEILQSSIRQLREHKSRSLSPEAETNLLAPNLEGVLPTTAMGNLESAFDTSDSYAVGALFYDLFLGKLNTLSQNQPVPFIHSLSFKCNHLLQKLVASNPSDRFSALQGAIACFVLLFGPRASEMKNTNDCFRWLVSEGLEIYLNPVLRDSVLLGDSDSSRRRLHYTYLMTSSPELIWSSCNFFNDF